MLKNSCRSGIKLPNYDLCHQGYSQIRFSEVATSVLIFLHKKQKEDKKCSTYLEGLYHKNFNLILYCDLISD